VGARKGEAGEQGRRRMGEGLVHGGWVDE
jgi:hypothetical protein